MLPYLGTLYSLKITSHHTHTLERFIMKKVLLLLICITTLNNAATQTKTLAAQSSAEITPQEWEATKKTALTASKWAGWKALQAAAITTGAYIGGYCGYRLFQKVDHTSLFNDFKRGNIAWWEREALFQGVGGVAGLQALKHGPALLAQAYAQAKPYVSSFLSQLNK